MGRPRRAAAPMVERGGWMMQKRSRYAGSQAAPATARQAADRTQRVRRANDRSRVTIPLFQAAEADKEAQRLIEREERAQERAGAPPFDGDARLTLYVVDRIVWLAHWMDHLSLNQLPPKTKRSRAEITALLRKEFPEDLIALAWTRLARRAAPVLKRVG
jgi:hypothetical protein